MIDGLTKNAIPREDQGKMRPLPEGAWASLVLSSIVLLSATLLAWRESRDRANRDEDLSPQDIKHFHHQDTRRRFGLVVMVLIAAGLVVGSLVPPQLGNRGNPPFVGVWLAVFLLIFALLSLAMIDWIALRQYARRHRSQILRERVELLQEEVRRRKSVEIDGNGHSDGPVGDLFP